MTLQEELGVRHVRLLLQEILALLAVRMLLLVTSSAARHTLNVHSAAQSLRLRRLQRFVRPLRAAANVVRSVRSSIFIRLAIHWLRRLGRLFSIP